MGRGRGKGEPKAKAKTKVDNEREVYRALHSKLSYLKKKGGDQADEAEKALAMMNSSASSREEFINKFAEDHKCSWLTSILALFSLFVLIHTKNKYIYKKKIQTKKQFRCYKHREIFIQHPGHWNRSVAQHFSDEDHVGHDLLARRWWVAGGRVE